jgi:hypothetical protein
MKKLGFLTLCLALTLSACSNVKAISSEDFSLFYSDIEKTISTAEIKSRESLDTQQILKTYVSDYAIYSDELDKISKKFLEVSSRVSTEQSDPFKNASGFLSSLNEEIKSESQYLEDLTCPLFWDDSKRDKIEECGRAHLRWGNNWTRALTCTYYFASLEFQNFTEFEIERVSQLSDLSDKDLRGCEIFKSSNSLYGYPQRVGVTWIPDVYQTKFLQRDQLFVVEIDDRLYAEYSGELLSDSLYGSWNGNCAVYRRYERLLQKNGFLLGSIKGGTCF